MSAEWRTVFLVILSYLGISVSYLKFSFVQYIIQFYYPSGIWGQIIYAKCTDRNHFSAYTIRPRCNDIFFMSTVNLVIYDFMLDGNASILGPAVSLQLYRTVYIALYVRLLQADDIFRLNILHFSNFVFIQVVDNGHFLGIFYL